MKLEAIKAAETLLNAKLISEQQFADLVIKSLNGHAAPAVALQQPQLPLRKFSRNKLTMEQIQSIVDMTLIGHPRQVIADNINVRHGTRLSKGGVLHVIEDILDGSKRAHACYNTPEWQAAFDRWEIALKAVS